MTTDLNFRQPDIIVALFRKLAAEWAAEQDDPPSQPAGAGSLTYALDDTIPTYVPQTTHHHSRCRNRRVGAGRLRRADGRLGRQ